MARLGAKETGIDAVGAASCRNEARRARRPAAAKPALLSLQAHLRLLARLLAPTPCLWRVSCSLPSMKTGRTLRPRALLVALGTALCLGSLGWWLATVSIESAAGSPPARHVLCQPNATATATAATATATDVPPRARQAALERGKLHLSYAAQLGLCNQLLSHVNALTLAHAVGAELWMPPVWARSSFNHVSREGLPSCGEDSYLLPRSSPGSCACPCSWLHALHAQTMHDRTVWRQGIPLSTLLDLGAMSAAWQTRGLVLHEAQHSQPPAAWARCGHQDRQQPLAAGARGQPVSGSSPPILPSRSLSTINAAARGCLSTTPKRTRP